MNYYDLLGWVGYPSRLLRHLISSTGLQAAGLNVDSRFRPVRLCLCSPNYGPTSQPGPIANRVPYLVRLLSHPCLSHTHGVINAVPVTDNAAPLCCRFAALRQVGGTRSDVAFPTCFSPLRTPCVVLSLEFTCGRWLELWRSLPGNHIETNGSSRTPRRHKNGTSDWTVIADSAFLLLMGFVVDS